MVLNIKDNIKKLKNFFNKSFKKINEKNCIRNRKINFLDIYYFINLYNSNPNTTYDKIHNKLLCDDTYSDISKNAFVKKRNDLSISDFESINNNLIKYIYNDLSINDKPRYLSIDASNLCFLSKLNNDFKPNKHDTYTNGCLSCLFDINLEIPINYNLSKSFNERNLLIEQFSHIKPNDVLIADRGYYSDELINKFIDNKFNFIFRLKSSELKVKLFNKLSSESNSKIIFNDNSEHYFYDYKYKDQIIKFKIVKYQTYHNKDIEKENMKDLQKNLFINKKNIDCLKKNITNLHKEKNDILCQNKIIKSIIFNNVKVDKKVYINSLKKNNINKKYITETIKIINIDIDSYLKFNNKIKEKINLIERVNNSIYYIITNKIDLSNDKIKELYKKRWEVETHFRFAKDKFKMRTMESKSLNIILQNILVTQFIFLLEGYLELLMVNELKKNKKFNKSSFIDIMHNYLIKHLLISKNNKKILNTINKILLIIVNKIIDKKIIDEAIPRITKRPVSKWININTT